MDSNLFLCLAGNPVWLASEQIKLYIMDKIYFNSYAGKQKCTYKIQDHRQMSQKQISEVDSG